MAHDGEASSSHIAGEDCGRSLNIEEAMVVYQNGLLVPLDYRLPHS
jgi:hypothetical protein